jgi:hypothetical protein
MTLDLANYEAKAREAVKAFWGNRAAAVAKQKELGRGDQGERAGVTGGKNMDGFIALIQDVIRANGLTDAHMTACTHPPRLFPSHKALGPADYQSRSPRSGARAEIPSRAILRQQL